MMARVDKESDKGVVVDMVNMVGYGGYGGYCRLVCSSSMWYGQYEVELQGNEDGCSAGAG